MSMSRSWLTSRRRLTRAVTIITQLFYDFDVFKAFVADCRAAGINVPIFPGIMPLNAYGGFKRMTGFCKTRVPPAMAAEMEKVSGDDQKDAFIAFGTKYMVDLCKKLVNSKLIPGLHFYCLNQAERSYAIMEQLGYLKTEMGSPISQMAATAGGVPYNKVKNV